MPEPKIIPTISQIITAEQEAINSEFSEAKSLLKKSNRTSLSQQELNAILNGANSSAPSENGTGKSLTPYLIGGAVILASTLIF